MRAPVHRPWVNRKHVRAGCSRRCARLDEIKTPCDSITVVRVGGGVSFAAGSHRITTVLGLALWSRYQGTQELLSGDVDEATEIEDRL